MTLEEIAPEIRRRLDLDAQLRPLPLLAQMATFAADVEQVKAYNAELEKAVSGAGGSLGVALTLIVSEGDDASPAVATLDLQNLVFLSVLVNPVQNKTGLTAFQLTRRILRVMKFARIALRPGARADILLAKPAYNVGPLSKGLDLYFINLLVRTTEDLGPLTPV